MKKSDLGDQNLANGSSSQMNPSLDGKLSTPTPSHAPTGVQNRRVTKILVALVITVVALLVVVWTAIEPFGRLSLSGYKEFRYSNPEGAYCTRTVLDQKGEVLRVERVHLRQLQEGGNGEVDGILVMTVYGKAVWGGATRPIITYDFPQQTVTKHTFFGDRTYAATGFEIAAYLDGQVVGLDNVCESSNPMVLLLHHGEYILFCIVPLTILIAVQYHGFVLAWLALLAQLTILLLSCRLVFRTLMRRCRRFRCKFFSILFTYLLTTALTNFIAAFLFEKMIK